MASVSPLKANEERVCRPPSGNRNTEQFAAIQASESEHLDSNAAGQ